MASQRRIILPKENQPFSNYLRLIWDYRYFTKALAIGEIKNKYSRMATGLFFSVIQTVLVLLVYWLVFGIAVGIDTKGIPYPVFVLPGILLWQYFSGIIFQCSGSLIQSEDLISKLNFPRISIPISRLVPGLIDLAGGVILFAILVFVFDITVLSSWLLFPLFLILLMIIAFGIGLWISILSLYNRDLSQIFLQVLSFLIFATPVFYPGTILPENFKVILYLNPIAGIIEYTRAILFGTGMPDLKYMIGFAIGLLLFVSALFVYKNTEKKIADLL